MGCKLCLNNFGGKGCKNKCTPSFDEMDTDVWSVPELGKNGKYAKTKWEQDEMDVDDEDAGDEDFVFDEDDEEAGGFSIEAGYEKDGKYAKIKYEKDELDDDCTREKFYSFMLEAEERRP